MGPGQETGVQVLKLGPLDNQGSEKGFPLPSPGLSWHPEALVTLSQGMLSSADACGVPKAAAAQSDDTPSTRVEAHNLSFCSEQ